MSVTHTCLHCGKQFSDIPSKKRVFCSRSCLNRYYKPANRYAGVGMTTFTCDVCGTTFQDFPSRKRRFCSRSCSHKHLEQHLSETRKGANGPGWKPEKDRTCDACGEVFHARKVDQRFCSMRCVGVARRGEKHHLWEGGSGNRNKGEWSAKSKHWRNAVLKRDDHQCRKCGSTDRLNAHHILSWVRHPDERFNVDNGITLCHPCHRIAHGQKPTA